ncbi:MAG: tRNA (adenosine(37)-N6)-threonylcarbamoyltransferase complex dimerization subunit type 1 TsaB [Candidatus Limnocylindria bacterium]
MIIAIDAASTDLSVALAERDGTLILDDAWPSAQRQSAELLPHLLELLERAERSLIDTTAVAVGTGPGSFTGLRVALALGKGLALSLERPILGVPSLQGWLAAHPDAAAALARAGAREAYLLPRGEESPRIVDRDALTALVGDARIVAPVELAVAFSLEGAEPPRAAGALAAMAAARLDAEAGGDDLRTLEPLYVRPPRGLGTESEGEVKWL